MKRWALICVAVLAAGVAGLALSPGRWPPRLVEGEGPEELAVALEDAWRGVRAEPEQAEAWIVLGDAQSALDQLAAAEQSYATALRLGGGAGVAQVRLGFLLYARGEDAQAAALLGEARRLGASAPLLEAPRRALARRPAAGVGRVAPAPGRAAGTELDAAIQDASFAAARDCAVALLAPEGGGPGIFRVEVQLEREPLLLIYDTGASITAINRDRLAAAGIGIDEEQRIRAFTAAGEVSFATAVVPLLRLGGREVRALRVAACEDCGGRGAGGLFGLDAQEVLGLELDRRRAEARFSDCSP